MAAWGPGSFDNDLASEYILTLVNTQIHPLILEEVPTLSSHTHGNDVIKHKCAYYYDRFRAAIELMILFEENDVYSFAKGYYDLAIKKAQRIIADGDWMYSWGGAVLMGGVFTTLNKKGKNYVADIERQIKLLEELRDKAKV